jgi:hypothetical protein
MLQQLVRAAIELGGLRRDATANVITKRGALSIVDFRNERDRSETVATGHQEQLLTIARHVGTRLMPAIACRERALPE